MTRDLNICSPKHQIVVWFKNGGLGDQICRLPALKYLIENARNVTHWYIIVPDYFIDVIKTALKHHVCNYNIRTIIIESESKCQWIIDMRLPARATDENWHSTLRTHLVDHAFHTLCDVTPTIKDKNYLQLPDNCNIHKLNIPPKYIVITTGSTVPVREWPAAQVNSVINWIRQQGLRIVFLGKQHVSKDIIGHFDAKINYHLGINLIDKTTLLEAHAIMSNAVAVIGLDNGLLHLAACSSVPIVAGYTTVSPKYRLPYRNNKLGWNCFVVEPDKDLDCRFCQSSCIINYEQDFRRCFHADYLCTKQLESKKWIRALKKALYGSSVATVSWY